MVVVVVVAVAMGSSNWNIAIGNCNGQSQQAI